MIVDIKVVEVVREFSTEVSQIMNAGKIRFMILNGVGIDYALQKTIFVVKCSYKGGENFDSI